MTPSFSAVEIDAPNGVTSAYHGSVPDGWMRRSVTVRGTQGGHDPFGTVLRELHDVISRARHDDWDGMGSSPASLEAVPFAERLIRMLPSTMLRSIVPTLTLDPDGEIALEWYVSPEQLVSVSVGADGRLAWAGMINGQEFHDQATLHDAIPDELLRRVDALIASRKES